LSGIADQGEVRPSGLRRRVLAGAVVLVGALLLVVVLARPDRDDDEPTASDRSTSTTAAGDDGVTSTVDPGDEPGFEITPSTVAPDPDFADELDALTGVGATVAQWDAAHEKVAVPEVPTAYGPMLDATAPTYVINCCEDRISSYLVVAPAGATLSDLQGRVAAELPPDATAKALEDRPGCPAQRFTSPTIEAVFGEGQVVAAVFYVPADPNAPDGLPYLSLSIVGLDDDLVC
jgi:hypothetical protein